MSLESLETNLGRRLVSSREGWAHQRLLPPAWGLVLNIVICFRKEQTVSEQIFERNFAKV